MKYTHAGVEIELVEATGTFRAKLNGEVVTAPSLIALKGKIDKATKFEQFTALVDRGRWHGDNGKERYKEVVIVGVKRAKSNSFRGQDFWVSSTGEHISEVFKKTPENIAKLKAYDDLYLAQQAEDKALTEKHRANLKKADDALARHVLPKAK